MNWVDELLESVKKLFIAFYADQFTKPNTSTYDCQFDEYFDQRMRALEVTGLYSAVPVISPVTAEHDLGGILLPNLTKEVGWTTKELDPEPQDKLVPIQQKSLSTNHLLTASTRGPGGRISRRAKKSATSATQTSSREHSPSSGRRTGKASGKKLRTWTVDGLADEDDGRNLDYSSPSGTADERNDSVVAPGETSNSNAQMGICNKHGQFILKDLDDEVDTVLSQGGLNTDGNRAARTGFGTIGTLFKNLAGGKVLSTADLETPLKGMEDQLLRKNVAREAALRLCDSVRQALMGTKISTFQSIETLIRSAMEPALEKILTPTNSHDLLRDIERVKSRQGRPYVISVVGVNGVGKSTNLSKLAFFLLQNRYRILITACDTFRSGAVEQLAVHVRNLAEQSTRTGGYIELYERGYGKDAANVARDAIQYAMSPAPSISSPDLSSQPFDVVLIDTAGRRHNDTRLMSSLAKFAQFAQPDKIFMVAEALVGTDSVMQARNFNESFGNQRRLDGFIVSKCDTVGSGIGTVVSLVHATGIPVVFLGVGQMYPDLRTLNVKNVIGSLMQ